MTAQHSTLYLRNLNQKIKKDEMKKSLYQLFSQFGSVIEIVYLGNQKLRGQAFVIFKDTLSADKAKRALVQFPLYDKPLVIEYAKEKSEIISKMEGTWIPKEKRIALENAQKKQEKRELDEPDLKKRKPDDRPSSPTHIKEEKDSSEKKPEKEAEKKPISRFLICTNLGQKATEMILVMVFQAFAGYKSAKLIKVSEEKREKFGNDTIYGKIEFQNATDAGVAMENLQGFKITPSNLMNVRYAEEDE